MPELPEVETTLRGIKPHIEQQTIHHVVVRENRLRWLIPDDLGLYLEDAQLIDIQRRGKYLLLHFQNSQHQGHVLIHLGMSGNLRIVPSDTPPVKHDHVDFCFNNNVCLRYHDPRRFGSILWTNKPVLEHRLLLKLGPEPLSNAFTAEYCWQQAQGRKTPIKTWLMNSHVVVGVGNIYANESLFSAGIHPCHVAGKVSQKQFVKLVNAIRAILKTAIEQGGTTLRDFVNAEGKPGYFAQNLNVYGRKGQACTHCQTPIKHKVIAQRATYYCPKCQKGD
jgi:formamidopyrimidine-DNA glycosylase